MKTLEAKPFDQNAENWKRENRLFTSTVLEAGASGKNRIGTHALEVIEQFDSLSLLKLLFLVRNWHCWSPKTFSRQMTPQSRGKTAKTAVFRHRWQAWQVVRSIAAVRHSPASAEGRHETGGVLSLFSSLSFDISMKNSVERWSSDIQGLFRVKIRKMALGSNDLSTLPLTTENCMLSMVVRKKTVDRNQRLLNVGMCRPRTITWCPLCSAFQAFFLFFFFATTEKLLYYCTAVFLHSSGGDRPFQLYCINYHVLAYQKNTLSWFTAFLQSRKQCVQIDGQKSSWQVTKSGIPQGTVLGPTLFLIYINDFPSCIDNDVSIFADDTTVYTIGLPINQNATAISLTADLNNADLWARIWGMLFNADKSEILSIRSQRAAASLQESDPVIHPISMNGVRVPACQKHKHLGVVINNSLSWSDHIDDVFTKCARHVGILNSLRKKLSKRCLTRIYKGYIRPRLEYACAVWSGGNTSKLLKLQQKFCRQHQVQLPNLSNRFKFHTLTLFYKIRNGLAPTYLSEILPETLALSSGRNLRRHVYPFPRINKSSTMQSFLPRATVFWNELPASIQSSSSLHSFKAKLRDLLKI